MIAFVALMIYSYSSNPYLRDHEPNPLAYSMEDIRRVVLYASDLGIQVVPEIDIPSHTAGWAGAYPNLVR